MATIKDAKFKTTCKFCEKKHLVSWKCLYCSDIYCNDCKKVHERFSVSKDHIIVSLGKLSDQMLAEQKLKILSALKSQGKCDLFCVSCQTRINAIDKVEEHVEHELDKYDSFQKDLEANILLLTSKINDEIDVLNQKDNRKQNELNKKEMKQEVQRRYEEVIESCRNRVKVLHNEIDQFYKDKDKRLKESLSEVNKERGKLLKANEKLKSLKQKNKTAELPEAYRELQEQWKQYLSILPSDESITFRAGDHTPVEFAAELGNLSYSSIAGGSFRQKHHLQLLETIEPTKLQVISLISPCGERQACVGGIKSKTIQLVDLANPSSPKHEISMTFYDFATSVDGNLLYISDFENKSLKALSKDGNLKTIRDFNTLFPTCVHVTSHDEIFVGIVESDSEKIQTDSRRAILKLSPQGNINVNLEFDPRGIRLFTVPYRCSVNETNNHVVVIDKYTPYTGRVIGIDEKGNVQFRYSGLESGTRNKLFMPTDIKCTYHGYTLICDIDNHSVHILDRNGTFIQNISTLDVKIMHPHSLAIDSNDKLWIGTGPPSTDKQKGQIFITSLTIK